MPSAERKVAEQLGPVIVSHPSQRLYYLTLIDMPARGVDFKDCHRLIQEVVNVTDRCGSGKARAELIHPRVKELPFHSLFIGARVLDQWTNGLSRLWHFPASYSSSG